MCYNASASVGSFLISLIGSTYLFLRNIKDDRLFAVIIFGVSIMQLGEYLIHIDINCDSPNKFNVLGSKIGFYSHIIIQPMFSLLATLLFGLLRSNYILILWGLLWVLHIKYSYDRYPKDKDFCSYRYKCDKGYEKIGCQLYWPWFKSINEMSYMSLVFFLPILLNVNVQYKLFWAIYVIFGPGVLSLLYPKTAASIWCFLGPSITILLKSIL